MTRPGGSLIAVVLLAGLSVVTVHTVIQRRRQVRREADPEYARQQLERAVDRLFASGEESRQAAELAGAITNAPPPGGAESRRAGSEWAKPDMPEDRAERTKRKLSGAFAALGVSLDQVVALMGASEVTPIPTCGTPTVSRVAVPRGARAPTAPHEAVLEILQETEDETIDMGPSVSTRVSDALLAPMQVPTLA